MTVGLGRTETPYTKQLTFSVYECSACMYVYSQCMCLMLQRMTGNGSPETGVTDGYKPQCECWEPDPESSARATGFLNYSLASFLYYSRSQLSSPL